jgi:hypothetical protein
MSVSALIVARYGGAPTPQSATHAHRPWHRGSIIEWVISIAGAKKHESRVAYAFTYLARTCDLTLMATRSVGAAYMKQASENFQAGSKLKAPEQGAAPSVLLATWLPLDGSALADTRQSAVPGGGAG